MSVIDLITRQPVYPVIEITKNDDTTYTFNPFTPTFDFRIQSLYIKPPVDAVGGEFTLEITSSDGGNSGVNTLISNIDEGNEFLFYMGKTDGSKKKIMRGVLISYEIVEDSPSYMTVKMHGIDFGSNILKHRIVNGQWAQDRLSNGNLDTTDTKTTVSQIVLDLLQKEQSYQTVINGTAATAEDQGIVVDSANILPVDFQLAVFNANMEFLDDKLQELDEIGATVHFVDPDKNFIMKQVKVSTSSLPAEILLTDDNADAIGSAWVSGKVGLIGQPATYIRGMDHFKRSIFGIGGENNEVDQSSTTTTSNTQLDTNWIAQKFTPTRNNVSKIVLYLSKVGTPTEDFLFELREDDGNKPLGSVLRSMLKPKAFLDVTGTTATPITFELNEELDANDDYWIVIRKSGDASNTYRWHHDGGSSGTNSTSSDDVTWSTSSSSNTYAFIHFYSTPVITALTKGSPTATSKIFHEDTVKKADITNIEVMRIYLRQASETMFKRKETISCPVYAPDTLIENGMKVRIRKQASGYAVDDDFIVGNVEYYFQGSEEGSPGPFHYNIEATRYVEVS